MSSGSSSSIISSLKAVVGDDEFVEKKILASKILLVGAGGIGCELLKNLSLTGFQYIHVIDLDTIDVSNLNRQLLFRSHHVGQPKCVVACKVAAGLSPFSDKVQYIAHHGNVCDDTKFHVEYVKQFDVILNALDNVVARRRMNRLALAANIPLIEAGTTGYLGQVSTIHKPSQTACYECLTQETGKVYPICTIRSTPSAPVHCIVWAKELYKLLFHDIVGESMLFEDNTTEEPSTYMDTVNEFRTIIKQNKDDNNTESSNTKIDDIARKLIQTLYVDEIQKQLDMDRYKTAQKKPEVLDESIISTSIIAPSKTDSYKQTDIWTPDQCIAEFITCLQEAIEIKDQVLQSFDKDDDLAMRFVTATSNLRSNVFQIEPLQSYYSAKGIAGNIIPAISTTNAIVAGIQILQCFQILKAIHEDNVTSLKKYCSYVNCIRNSTRNGLYITAAELESPNTKCFVCNKATIPLQLNLNNWTLNDFLEKIIKKDLGFEHPSIMMDSGDYIWEEGDDADDFTINLNKNIQTLPCGGIQNGKIITVEDFSQDLIVEISVSHVEIWDNLNPDEQIPDPQKFIIGGNKPAAKSSENDMKKLPSTENGDNNNKDATIINGDNKTSVGQDKVNDDDDDILEIFDNNNESSSDNKKRPAEELMENGDVPPAKKSKQSDTEVIEID